MAKPTIFNDCKRGDHQGCLGTFQHHDGWVTCQCPCHRGAPATEEGAT